MKKESDSYVIDGMRIWSEARKRRRRKGGEKTKRSSGLEERERRVRGHNKEKGCIETKSCALDGDQETEEGCDNVGERRKCNTMDKSTV